MPVPTISWEGGADGCVKMIDQTRLPEEVVFVRCNKAEEIRDAVKRLVVRGAPAIGIAGGFGLYLGIRHVKARDFHAFYHELQRVKEYLLSSRPTAVNLLWALERMEETALLQREKPIEEIKDSLLEEGIRILEEDRKICRELGRIGASFVKDGDTLLTYCNAGGLATADYGTALAVFFRCAEEGKRIRVFSGETRPLLQGSRLTCWELQRAGIETILICDNMIAHVMRDVGINAVFVGADRIAANGDIANKIGTYGIAVLAERHRIPLYVVAPLSTFDLTLPDGKAIPIEERDGREITHFSGKKISPPGIRAYNPAFDITPAQLISAIITEKGSVWKPDSVRVKGILDETPLP